MDAELNKYSEIGDLHNGALDNFYRSASKKSYRGNKQALLNDFIGLTSSYLERKNFNKRRIDKVSKNIKKRFEPAILTS